MVYLVTCTKTVTSYMLFAVIHAFLSVRYIIFIYTFFSVNINLGHSSTDLSGAAAKLFITSEGFLILDALKIIAHSLYNCRVFGYYGGIRKLTALMKGTINAI